MGTHRKRSEDQRREVHIPLETEGHINNHLENIGRNGLRCYTKKHIDEMTLLDMRFQLPNIPIITDRLVDGGWIECRGVVINCQPVRRSPGDKHYEVAVYFSEISDENKNLLADFISRAALSGI